MRDADIAHELKLEIEDMHSPFWEKVSVRLAALEGVAVDDTIRRRVRDAAAQIKVRAAV